MQFKGDKFNIILFLNNYGLNENCTLMIIYKFNDYMYDSKWKANKKFLWSCKKYTLILTYATIYKSWNP